MDNKALAEEVPRGNGTMCTFRSIKLKSDASSLRTKTFHGHKVTTVNARDVEYMVCEVIDNNEHIKGLTKKLQSLSTDPENNKDDIKRLERAIDSERSKRLFNLKPITTHTTVKYSINEHTPPLTFKAILLEQNRRRHTKRDREPHT